VVLHTFAVFLEPRLQLLLRLWLRTTSEEIEERKRRKSIPRERKREGINKKMSISTRTTK